VVEAHDGVEALAVLEIRRDVAAMLTDIAMPNMNGVALAKIVSERWPHIGIVITTGAVPRDVELEVPPQARILPKPYSAQRLVQAIEAVLPLVGGPVTLKSLPTIPAGREFGAGGLAQPLPKPEE
jgi:CheY-like chemotaxis protein